MAKGDKVDKAMDAVKENPDTINAQAILTGGRPISITAPYPFSADDFESAIVILLNMRAQSQARQATEKPIVAVKPGIIVPGRPS